MNTLNKANLLYLEIIKCLVILQLLFINCISNRALRKYDPSVDYCKKMESLKQYQYFTDSATKDSTNDYGFSMICCLYQKILNHNKDSLTTDTCLCLKRLENALKSDYDSISILIDAAPDTNIKQVTVSPKDPNILDGIHEYLINASCKILGFDNIKTKNKNIKR